MHKSAGRFKSFLNKWVEKHVTTEDRELCKQLLEGPGDDAAAAGVSADIGAGMDTAGDL